MPESTPSVLEAMDLFRGWFRGASWSTWRAVLGALFGLQLSEADQAIIRQLTGHAQCPQAPCREGWFVMGRRAGKSLIAAFVAVYLAVFRSYDDVLQRGERGTLMLIAADRRQARTLMRYVLGFFELPGLAGLIERRTQDALYLTNRVVIEIHTASFKSVRGYTLIGAICDEVAFWTAEDSANPDVEIITALRPALATVPGSLLLAISSPYARRGLLWKQYNAGYGRPGPSLVVQAPSAVMNPTLDPAVIAAALAEDEPAAQSEWLAQFRRDLEAFVSREVLEACVVLGRVFLPPVRGVRYCAFADPAGGSGADAFTWGIAHAEERAGGQVVILDALEERKLPFSPEATVRECAGHLAVYGVGTIVGDRYGGSWLEEQFSKCGVTYVASERVKSDIYRDSLPLLTSGSVELLDLPKLSQQLVQLERRVACGGRDSIDHAPNAHDDLCNSACGVLLLAAQRRRSEPAFFWGGEFGDYASARQRALGEVEG
jgi:hypothetical protein